MAGAAPLVSARTTAGAVLVIAGLISTGCHSVDANAALDPAALNSDPPISSPLPAVAPEVWASRGQIVEQEPIAPIGDSDVGQSRRAVYLSVSGVDGGVRRVSGTFFTPRTRPPQNGWPVISLAHPTTGIGNDCGPSGRSDLMGFLPAIKALVGGGFAVAFSDYEGLGTPGRHPYLEPRSAAFNIIDAVRALRALFPDASSRWIAVGSSQGGQAAWAANELDAFYGAGLDQLGTVALSPAADITGAADQVYTGSLTKEQQALIPLLVLGLDRYNPQLNPATLLRGQVAAHTAELIGCGPHAAALRRSLRFEGVVRSHDAAATDILRTALRKIALPQRPLSKPMLVINGLRDQTVLPEWVTKAVIRSCRLGGTIEHSEIPDAGHSDLGASANEMESKWILDRFAGTAPPSNCQVRR